jgi:hypothetical protein
MLVNNIYLDVSGGNNLIKFRKCEKCKEEKAESSYLPNHTTCCRCEFKLKNSKKPPDPAESKCIICMTILIQGRWIYCSNICSDKAKRERKHWTAKINYDSRNFKKRFNVML